MRTVFSIFLTIIVVCTSHRAMAQDPYKGFNLAWKYFTAGDYTNASDLADQFLKDEQLDTGLIASFSYLKGYLLSKQRNAAEQAISFFQNALVIYERSNNLNGVFSVNMGLAKVFLDQKKHLEANLAIRKAFVIQSDESKLGFTHYLKGRLHFQLGNYEKSLTEALNSLDAYELAKDKSGVAQAHTQIALLRMLNGEWEKGFEETLESQKGLVRVGDPNHYFFSLANIILYHRYVNGRTPTHPIELIEARLEREYDQDLERILEFVLEYDWDQ